MRYIYCKHCGKKIFLPPKEYLKEIECECCGYINDLLYDFDITIYTTLDTKNKK